MGGVAVQRGYGLPLMAASLGAAALVLAGRWRRGFVIGLLVLSALNGLPFIDMTTLSAGLIPGATDLFIPVLFVVLLIWNLERGAEERSPRLRRLAWVWCAAMATWWALVWLWSVTQGIPPLTAALYGRDFLYFALLVPLTMGALRGREDLIALGVSLGAGALVYAMAQHLAEFGGLSPSSFIHTDLVGGTEGGFKRYFAPMGHLEGAGVCLGSGLALLGPGRLARAAGWTLLGVIGSAVVLQFTRAYYAAFLLGFVVVTGLWATRGGDVGQRLRRATGVGAAVLAATVAVYVLTGTSIDRESAPGLVVNRAASGVTQAQEGTGTFGQRHAIYDSMFRTLGSSWPVGLGFLDPGVHYVAGVPRGAIRNDDVGLLSAVMTMGVIGLVLLFVPVVAIVALAVRSASRSVRDHWLAYGASVFLVVALLSSPTLNILFSVPGLVLTAIICASACRVLEPTSASRGRQPAAS